MLLTDDLKEMIDVCLLASGKVGNEMGGFEQSGNGSSESEVVLCGI